MATMIQIDEIATDNENPLEPVLPRRRRRPLFQYSLRTLFVLTTLVAILCSALFAAPWWFSVATLAVLGVLIPLGLIVAIIYARGYLRTFCIGALFPAVPALLVSLYLWTMVYVSIFGVNFSDLVSGHDGDEYRLRLAIALGVALALIAFCGLFAMLVRWLVEPRAKKRDA